MSLRTCLRIAVAWMLAGCSAPLGGDSSGQAGSGAGSGEHVASQSAALNNGPDLGCVSGTYSGHDYWFCPTVRSWQDARSKCQSIGFDLASIESSAENQYLLSKVPVNAWIGGSDSANEGVWRWSSSSKQFWQGKANGSAVGGAFTKWKATQPDDLLGQDCQFFLGGLGLGFWSDESCGLLGAFVCEGDLCPSDPNKTAPGACGCGIADTDSDGDGTPNCNDGCPSDPSKASAGTCGCDMADTDTDHDGTADCKDECPRDPAQTTPGDCGCSDAPKPAGTACDDGVCPGAATCDGHGTCGSPAGCVPDSNCRYVKRFGHVYWFCSNSRSWVDARNRCRGLAGGDLIAIDDADEQAVVNAWQTSDSWISGNDRRLEGAWRWTSAPFDDGVQFWSGTASGSAVPGAFTAWATGQPDNNSDQDCAYDVRSSTSAWYDGDCREQRGFICEVGADLCPNDPAKGVPGVCGCGVSDADRDGDGTPDCKDQCPDDPLRVLPGTCGCIGKSNPAPAGTSCQDGICGASTCDGAGSCGRTQDCAPDSNCTAKFYHRKVYWVCKNGRIWSDARTRCASRARTSLVTVDDPAENDFVAGSIVSDAWIGANDSTTEGKWLWTDGKQLWSGKASGNPVGGKYSAWDLNQPDDLLNQDCASLEVSDGEWTDDSCSTFHHFVCETCIPATCAMLGAQCGTVSDGCGGTLNCDGAPLGCHSPQVCFTAANRCSDPKGDDCRAGVKLDPSLPPEQAMRKFYADASECAAPGMSPCLAKMLGDSHYDTHEAASRCAGGKVEPSDHATLNLDRAHKQQAARADATYACREAAGDGDHDLVPDDIDQCPNTPPLTPTDAVGCTTTFRVRGPDKVTTAAHWARTKLMRDPDCDGMTFVPTPVPYAIATINDPPSKSIHFFLSNHPAGCDMFYEIDASAVLADGSHRSFHLGFKESEAEIISLPPPCDFETCVISPLYFFTIQPSDPGDRGAWAAAQTTDVIYSIRARNGNAAVSGWSAAVHQGREPRP